MAEATKKPGVKLQGFTYQDTDGYVTAKFSDGKWGPLETSTEKTINLHIGATVLHYGQSVFEGLKAFRGKDEKIRIFRPDENCKRMALSAERTAMPPVPEDLFLEAVKKCTEMNADYVPTYESGGSLYIRPFLFGSSPVLGLTPSPEYTFMVFVVPVSAFYKDGIKSIKACVLDEYDRAAPKGVGNIKVAGNYATTYVPDNIARSKGYSVTLYLDSATNSCIEEFSSANFVAISADGTKYITPLSPSILASITNKSLCILAADQGLTVERREIKLSEIENFSEVAGCGTAVVLTPVSTVNCKGKDYTFKGTAETLGPVLEKLYNKIVAIQRGDEADTYKWNLICD